jgi:hypothetical protein
MQEMKESLSFQMKTKTDQLQKQCFDMQKENLELKGMINDLSLKCDSLENHSRRNNLLFFGVRKDFEHESWEDCEETVREVIKDGIGISEHIDIERAHRTKGNAIVAKLLSFKQKTLVLNNARRLKNSETYKNVTVREDFSALVRSKRKGLSEMQKAMYDAGKRPKMRFDKLITSDGVFTYDLAQDKVVKLKEWEEAPQRGQSDWRGEVNDQSNVGGAEGGRDGYTDRSILAWDQDPFGFPSASFPPLDRHQLNDDTAGSQFSGTNDITTAQSSQGKPRESQGNPGATSSDSRARRDSYIPLAVHKSPMKLRQRSLTTRNIGNDSGQPKINTALSLQRGNSAQGRGQGQHRDRGGKPKDGGRGRGGSSNTDR